VHDRTVDIVAPAMPATGALETRRAMTRGLKARALVASTRRDVGRRMDLAAQRSWIQSPTGG